MGRTMVIFDENTKPVLIDNISTPMLTTHFWVLDLEERDFKLKTLDVLEEHTTPMLVIQIYGYSIELPADWNILISSKETSQLDITEVSDLTRGNFSVFVMNHKNNKIHNAPVKVIHYEPKAVLYAPSLAKNQMLCHALGPLGWFCVSPLDNYNKYLKNALTADLLY